MKKSVLFASLVFSVIIASVVLAAGESRKPIPASAKKYAAQFVITQSGSYYLAGNRLCDTNGIVIEANDVTIDLRGFTLTGRNKGSGIYLRNRHNVEISSGTIADFNYAVNDDYVYMGTNDSSNHRVISLRAESNTQGGIKLYAFHSTVKDCVVISNGTSASGTIYAVSVGTDSIVTGNIIYDNGNSAVGSGYIYGISANCNCIITGNTVYYNAVSANIAFTSYGISAATGSIISNNTVRDNSVASGSSYGIVASGNGCSVISNTVCGNGASSTGAVYGIYADAGCIISGNSAYLNGNTTTGSVDGIYAGVGTSVIANNAFTNGNAASGTVYGIHLMGNNFVNQNTSYSNGGTNMSSCASCTFGDNHAP
jgi:hypothetical protein